jgi:peptidoglycan/xylan/chitin deacetylase (PgdA/CDA1 family)
MFCTPLNRLRNAVDPPVVVLLYHRVAKLANDPELLAVTPDNFRRQMHHLKATVPVVRFEADWSELARPAVAITFDDGYADNLVEALPILEEVGLPATFFISTGTIGTAQQFWWHELEHLILGKPHLPASFALNDQRPTRTWSTGTQAERRQFYYGMVRLINEVDAGQRDRLLLKLRRWAGSETEPASLHRTMTVDELQRLAASSGVTIGAHTVTHTRLSALSEEAQREEIVSSKRQLEIWLNRELTVFSYPFGRRCEYNRQSMAICREAGFRKAAANFPGQVHRWTDPYQIPRHLVRDWPVELFAEKLRGFWTR